MFPVPRMQTQYLVLSAAMIIFATTNGCIPPASDTRDISAADLGFFDPPQRGELVDLPVKDSFGQVIHRSRITVYSLPDCQECSSTKIDLKRLTTDTKQPILFTFQTSVSQIPVAYRKLRAPFYVIAKSNCDFLPLPMKSVQPSAVELDEKRRITSTFGPEEIAAQMARRTDS